MSEEEGQPTEMEKAFLAANESRRQRGSSTPSVASHTVSAEAPAADANEHPILPPFDKTPSQIPQGAEVLPIEEPKEEKKEEPVVKKRHSIFGK
jgi:hypothetical protein